MSSIIPSKAITAAPVKVSDASAVPITDLGASGTPLVVFPAVDSMNGPQERFIVNPNAAGSFWVTFLDTIVPAANGAGSFEIAPGAAWAGSVLNEVRLVTTANNMKLTAGERR